jgi:hypothetical protein
LSGIAKPGEKAILDTVDGVGGVRIVLDTPEQLARK